jgi:preprotein translocase subunit Sec61beta
MPSSGAGLTRYFEESDSKIRLKPEYVIVIIILVIILELILRFQGNAWFGLQ